MQRDFTPAATGGGLTSPGMGNSSGLTQTQGSSSTPLSLVPEKAILGHQIRSTVPAQYWGMSMASASSPDGAMASHMSDPAPLPLLAGSGLSRPHLLLATQALKVPGQPSVPGLPSICQNEGGLVLDRVLAHASGDSWWAALSGRARLGRIAAQRADLVAAAGNPSNYSLCAISRVQLSRYTVLRSRLDWRPPAPLVRGATASGTNSGGVEADAGSSAGAVANGGSGRGHSRDCRRGWAAPTSLSCQLRSRVAARMEVRADLAIGQRAASSFPWSPIPAAASSPLQAPEASAASAGPYEKGSARGGSSPGLRRPRVAEAEEGSCGWAARTPLLIGLQAGSVGAAGSPLVWRCGLLQVTAPPTVRLVGLCGSDGAAAAGGPALQSAVYVQGTVGLQGERYLWRAPKKPQRRRSRGDAAAVSTAAAASSATGHVAEAGLGGAAAVGPSAAQTPPPPAPGLGPHNPVRQAAGYVLNRIGGRGGDPAGDDNDDDDDGGGVTARGGGAGGKAGATISAAAGGGGGEPPFGIELPTAGQVHESLMDATMSISRLRDDVTQATQWVAGGGLVEQLSATSSGAAGGGGVAARQRQQQQQQEQSRADQAATPWSAFVGPPNVKVAGIAGLTARAPVIMLTHGSAGGGITPASADGKADTAQSKARRGGLLGPAPPSSPCLLPVRLAWMHDLGLAQIIRRFQGRDVGAEGEGGATGPAAVAAPAGTLLPMSRGSLRPFASAAASVQAGHFSGWVLDFTRLSCQLDCGLWGPVIQGARGGGASHPGSSPAGGSSGMAARQRHPAFALGDNGAWHSLSVSLSQQVVGPLRFAADWRYELASSRPLALPPPPPSPVAEPPPPLRTASGKAALAAAAGAAASWLPGAAAGVAGHLGGMRPQLMDAVYALDLGVPGARGAARLVAWYAPHRREGMVELRMF